MGFINRGLKVLMACVLTGAILVVAGNVGTQDGTPTVALSRAFGVNGVNLGYGVGNWPPATYRPFSDDSPFNTPVPAGAKVDPASASYVSDLMAGGAPNAINANIEDTNADFYKPTCWAGESDPLYTLRTNGYQHDGETLHVPSGCREAGGSDHHLTVNESDGSHWGFWNALVDNKNRIITGNATNAGHLTARKGSLMGTGTGSDATGCGAVAAGFCNYAGIIRAQELAACKINHALFITSKKTSGRLVYPAAGKGDSGSGIIPEGTRFQLTAFDISGFPCWKRAVLGAFQNYGAYLGDTSGAASFALGVESDSMYVAFTNPRTGVPFRGRLSVIAEQQGVKNLALAGVDWAGRLRVIAPCVTQKTC